MPWLQSYQRIHLIALQDPLTGLSNRRLLDEHLKQLILLSHRKKKRFALLVIDLNRFKPVNDRFGHEAGDLVLVSLAHRLRNTLRESDIIARVGGDEFILLFHDMTTRADADSMRTGFVIFTGLSVFGIFCSLERMEKNSDEALLETRE